MILIKELSKPEYCDHCYLCQMVCIGLEKYVRCPILKKMGDVNLVVKGAHQPVPDDCPIIEVEPYGPEGTLYKEK